MEVEEEELKWIAALLSYKNVLQAFTEITTRVLHPLSDDGSMQQTLLHTEKIQSNMTCRTMGVYVFSTGGHSGEETYRSSIINVISYMRSWTEQCYLTCTRIVVCNISMYSTGQIIHQHSHSNTQT